MRPLNAADALCRNRELVPVKADDRPAPNRRSNAIYAIFQEEDEGKKFLGLVTEREIALFPQRIFGDLFSPHAPPPLNETTPLESLCPRCADIYSVDLPRAVVDREGGLIGALTYDSVLEALLRRERQLLEETLRLNELLETDRDMLAVWSARLNELCVASRTLLGLLAHTTIHEELLQCGIDALAKLLQARYGAIGILDEDGKLRQFVQCGLSAEEVERIGHYPEGKGLLGVVVNENQTLRLADIAQDPRSGGFPPHHPAMKTLLAAPISHRGRVYGRVYLSDKRDGAPFTGEDELLAISFAHSLSLVLDNAREIEEMKQMMTRLDYMAHYDSLTGLPNRKLFADRLQQAVKQHARYDGGVCLMFLDIDNFKLVNDTLGHPYGDRLLQQVSARIQDCLRESDTVARLGGDEFCILLVGLEDVFFAARVAQKILNALTPPFLLDGHENYLSASIGIALPPQDGEDIDHLLKNADAAMYHAKAQGKNNYQFFAAAMNADAQWRLRLERQLRHALENHELNLHYQPQIDVESGAIIGVEALLRWSNHELGAVSPAQFIPLAEETGLIIPIGEWVLRTACRQAQAWRERGAGDLRLAVNLSARQFDQPDLVKSIAQILEETAFPPNNLELEITESMMMRNTEETIRTLRALKRFGVRFAMDDFGTGYSSLSYLKRLSLDVLKIDQSFVRDVERDSEASAIVTAIIALAESLNLRTVAEGVETAAQLDFLRRRKCSVAQGYYFARPQAAAEIERLLAPSGSSARVSP
jgi:diguanylate cyclase (GGDEF)-like protein